MKGKIFNDPIHGHIEVSEICVKIIDTPQYQRLRDISQLGGLYYVFSGASSNRFEHCIGVSHLAKTFAEQLRSTQPELNITDSDVCCVEIAGLIHDLGHGPFSHMFDMKFLKRAWQLQDKSPHFEHEFASIGIFDVLVKENNLMPVFKQHGITEDDIHFVKELILGDEHEIPDGFIWKGRGEKTFLYDIVANKRNGIDVDKFDYFARDCHVLGLSKSFDCKRLMKFARVLKVSRNTIAASSSSIKYEICFHIKEAWNLFELFHTRYALHKRAYQHRVATSVECMICDALLAADPYINIPSCSSSSSPESSETIVQRKMSECPFDMNAYWKLTDYILKVIEFSTSNELASARTTIQRVQKRDLYQCVGELLLTPEHVKQLLSQCNKSYSEISDKITQQLMEIYQKNIVNKNKENNSYTDMIVSNILCTIIKMGYGGKGGKNPVSELTTFYVPKHKLDDDDEEGKSSNTSVNTADKYIVGVAPPDSVSRLLPREFEETYVRIYSKTKAMVGVIKPLFERWCETQGIATDEFINAASNNSNSTNNSSYSSTSNNSSPATPTAAFVKQSGKNIAMPQVLDAYGNNLVTSTVNGSKTFHRNNLSKVTTPIVSRKRKTFTHLTDDSNNSKSNYNSQEDAET